MQSDNKNEKAKGWGGKILDEPHARLVLFYPISSFAFFLSTYMSSSNIVCHTGSCGGQRGVVIPGRGSDPLGQVWHWECGKCTGPAFVEKTMNGERMRRRRMRMRRRRKYSPCPCPCLWSYLLL